MLETVFVCLGINFQTNEALRSGSFSSHHTRTPFLFFFVSFTVSIFSYLHFIIPFFVLFRKISEKNPAGFFYGILLSLLQRIPPGLSILANKICKIELPTIWKTEKYSFCHINHGFLQFILTWSYYLPSIFIIFQVIFRIFPRFFHLLLMVNVLY